MIKWSEEIPFERNAITSQLPRLPGVYRFLQSEDYPRYKSTTRVLKIGISKADLRDEVLNHLIRHTAANRLSRIRNRSEVKVTIDFILATAEAALQIESKLLQEFEDEYWDLPLLNSQRGYARGRDLHYKE